MSQQCRQCNCRRIELVYIRLVIEQRIGRRNTYETQLPFWQAAQAEMRLYKTSVQKHANVGFTFSPGPYSTPGCRSPKSKLALLCGGNDKVSKRYWESECIRGSAHLPPTQEDANVVATSQGVCPSGLRSNQPLSH